MNHPLVSIQIPTYNQKRFIKEALESVLAQSYENIQIIVSDDDSSEYDIFETLEAYKNNPKVQIHRNEKNLGRVANYRNTLYKFVRGTWFVNLDGDDYFTDKDFIKRAVEGILKYQENNNIIAFQSGARSETLIKATHFSKKLEDALYLISGQNYIADISNWLGFTHASVLFKTDLAKEVGFYAVDSLDIDYFSYLKLIDKGSFLADSKVVYQWRRYDEQASNSQNFKNVVQRYKALEDFKKHCNRTVYSRSINDLEYTLFVFLFNAFLGEGNKWEQFKILKKYVHFKFAYIKQAIFGTISFFKRKIIKK